MPAVGADCYRDAHGVATLELPFRARLPDGSTRSYETADGWRLGWQADDVALLETLMLAYGAARAAASAGGDT